MILISILVGGSIGALGVVFLLSTYRNKQKTQKFLDQAVFRVESAKKMIADEHRDALIKLKDELNRRRVEFKNELKRDQIDFDRLREKLEQRSKTIDQRDADLNVFKGELQHKERELVRLTEQVMALEVSVKEQQGSLLGKLERIANMSQDEARQELAILLKQDVRHAHEKWFQKA